MKNCIFFSDATNVKDLDQRVVEMYKNVGLVLRKYRSGKVPKAFKVLPTLSNWEQVMLTYRRFMMSEVQYL